MVLILESSAPLSISDEASCRPPSFGHCLQREWKRRLDEQPMDFFVRQYEPAWFDARRRLAEFVGPGADNLVFVENATAGMNVVADSFSCACGPATKCC